jgi:hypothetical protein
MIRPPPPGSPAAPAFEGAIMRVTLASADPKIERASRCGRSFDAGDVKTSGAAVTGGVAHVSWEKLREWSREAVIIRLSTFQLPNVAGR